MFNRSLYKSILFISLTLVVSLFCQGFKFKMYSDNEFKDDLQKAQYPPLMVYYNEALAELQKDGCNMDLNNFYGTLNPWENVKLVQDWAKAEPENYIPWTALGMACYNKGLEYRGGGLSSSVSPENKKLFLKYMEGSKPFFKKALALKPKDPYVYTSMMDIGLQEQWSDTMMQSYFDKALEVSPQNEQAIWNMALHYSPLWGGTQEKMNKFVDQYGRSAPQGSYLRLLVVRYHEEIWRSKGKGYAYFFNTPAWYEVKKECEDYLTTHSDDMDTRSWYAFIAFVGKHFPEANEQFNALGDQWDANMHWTKRGYGLAKQYARKMTSRS